MISDVKGGINKINSIKGVKSMSGKMARGKGRRGEYEVRDILQEACNEVCLELGLPNMSIERNVDQVRSFMGNGKGSDLAGLPWFAIEVKYQENDSAFNGWWKQCREAAWVYDEGGDERDTLGRKGRYAREPMLFWRKNWAGWSVRLFGHLFISSNTKVRIPVDINLPTFLLYFKPKIKFELGKLTREIGIHRLSSQIDDSKRDDIKANTWIEKGKQKESEENGKEDGMSQKGVSESQKGCHSPNSSIFPAEQTLKPWEKPINPKPWEIQIASKQDQISAKGSEDPPNIDESSQILKKPWEL